MTSEAWRLMWTAIGLAGSILGVIALGTMIWLSREADRFVWALEQYPDAALNAHRLFAHGDFWDSVMLTGAVGGLLLVVTCEGGAGVAALVGEPQIAIVLLVASEILLVGSLLVLVGLGIMKLRRRRISTSAVQLRPRTEA